MTAMVAPGVVVVAKGANSASIFSVSSSVTRSRLRTARRPGFVPEREREPPRLAKRYAGRLVRENGRVPLPPLRDPDDDAPKEACGVFGIYAPGRAVAHLTFDGMFALQHRGQESAGMAVS